MSVGQFITMLSAASFLTGILLYSVSHRRGYQAGFSAGYKKGKAEGWLEHYDETVKRERERRDRLGRFRAINVGRNVPTVQQPLPGLNSSAGVKS